MKNYLISIVIPAYNVEKYIARCLDSVLAQTYENIEVIVVNDGSKDETGRVIDEYAARDSRIIPIHKENGGVTSARLAGIKAAVGDYIGFVDGDDILDNDMYELLITNAIKYDADISHCGYKMVFDDGRVNYFHNTGVVLEHDKNTAIKYLLDGSLVEPGLGNKLYRKELFSSLFESGKMDRTIRINEDLLMNYILFTESEKSVFYDECKYHYIVRSGSATRTKLNDNIVFDPLKVKQIILESSTEETKEYAEKAYISTCIDSYNKILVSKDKHYIKKLPYFRSLIKENSELIRLLGKKRRLLAGLIIRVNVIYNFMYRIYARYFQEKRYE